MILTAETRQGREVMFRDWKQAKKGQLKINMDKIRMMVTDRKAEENLRKFLCCIWARNEN